jgi:hypothetical protein
MILWSRAVAEMAGTTQKRAARQVVQGLGRPRQLCKLGRTPHDGQGLQCHRRRGAERAFSRILRCSGLAKARTPVALSLRQIEKYGVPIKSRGSGVFFGADSPYTNINHESLGHSIDKFLGSMYMYLVN